MALRALEPLDERLAAGAIDSSDYFAGIWDTNVVAGQLYGVPWYVDTRLHLLPARPAARGRIRPPAANLGQSGNRCSPRSRSAPGRVASRSCSPSTSSSRCWRSRCNRTTRCCARTVASAISRAQVSAARSPSTSRCSAAAGRPKPPSADVANVWNEFGRGYFSFYISGPWNIGEFKRRLPPEAQDSWMTAPLPGPDGPGASIAGGSSLVVFRASRQKDAAWQLVEYLSQPDIQRQFHDLTGDLPPRRTSWSGGSLADDLYARAFRDQLERVKPAPRVPEWERIATEMRLVAERACTEGSRLPTQPRELDARADAILEKRRWLLARGAPR